MAAEYEEFLRKIQEGLTARTDRTKGRGGPPPPPSQEQQQQEQQQQQQQQQLPASLSFKELYDNICQEIRSSGTLDIVMNDFQGLMTDLERVSYIMQRREVQAMQLEENYSRKSEEEATTYERAYDVLIPREASAGKALEVIKKSIQKTPPDNTSDLAVRYMKRGWALLLLEHFEDAETDAKRSLSYKCPDDLMWNAHEILGHCRARLHDYKAADTSFNRALEGLRKSTVLNEVKAVATVRIMAVFKTVKAKKNKKGSMMKKTNQEKKTVPPAPPQLSYGQNKSFPSASAALSFITRDGRGRCTIVNRDVKPGDVLMVDTPFCTMINPPFLESHCLHCYTHTSTPVPCSSCAKVWYCSEACQEASWAGQHSTECHVFDYLVDASIGKLALLSFRVLTTVTWAGLQKLQQDIEGLVAAETERKSEEWKEVERRVVEGEGGKEDERKATEKPLEWRGKYLPHDYQTVLHLASNSEKRTFGDMFKRSVTAVFLACCLKTAGYFGSNKVEEQDLSFAASVLLRHLQGSSCNAYEISELEVSGEGLAGARLQEVGGALYTTVSLTNHACAANAARSSVGNRCVLRAMVPISRGNEVLDNYGHFFHSSTVNERREVLLNQYKFACECEACSAMWPLYPHHTTEILVFCCPSPGCYSPCSYQTSSRTSCNVCGNQQQYAKLMRDMEHLLKQYKDLLDQVKKGSISHALPQLLSHITFLSAHVVPPVKHFTDLQEVVKQCFNLQGNVFHHSQAAATVQAVQRVAPRLRPGKKEVIVPR